MLPVYKKTIVKCFQSSEIHYQGFLRNKNIPNRKQIFSKLSKKFSCFCTKLRQLGDVHLEMAIH